MKKLSLFFAGLFFLLLSVSAEVHAQAPADYFVGKWNVVVKGTPNGDSKMILVLDQKDGALTGVVQDATGKEMSKIDQVDLGENTVTVYFNANGYDVNLDLAKKDDDHVTGSMMGMFDAEGERVKGTSK